MAYQYSHVGLMCHGRETIFIFQLRTLLIVKGKAINSYPRKTSKLELSWAQQEIWSYSFPLLIPSNSQSTWGDGYHAPHSADVANEPQMQTHGNLEARNWACCCLIKCPFYSCPPKRCY